MKNEGGESKNKAYAHEQGIMNIKQYMLFIFSNVRHFEVSLDETKYIFHLFKFEKHGSKNIHQFVY